MKVEELYKAIINHDTLDSGSPVVIRDRDGAEHKVLTAYVEYTTLDGYRLTVVTD